MPKILGIIASALLLLAAGCTTPMNEPPREWSASPAPPQPIMRTNASKQPAKSVSMRTNLPVVHPPPVMTWTSLSRWAADNKLPPLHQLSNLPLATFSISSPKGKMVLEIGSREALWNGMIVHLGFAPEIIDDQIFVHGLDLQKNLEPLLVAPALSFGTNRVLVLDPGHGGVNVGTHVLTDGRFEKEFTLDWARRIKTLLVTNGWRVLLTRTNDIDVSLSNRVAFAEANRADVFISLHFNSAAPDTKQNGVETYCLTPTGMPSTLTRGYSDLWLDRYPNNAFDTGNLQLAVKLHAAILRASGEDDRGIRRARFMSVLQGQRRPAVLIEGGFLSNHQDAQKIESGAFRQRLAEAVANALK